MGLICGDIPLLSDGVQPGRYEIMERFEKKELDILLSSEVGGEGLDFQFCQAIVNYDIVPGRCRALRNQERNWR